MMMTITMKTRTHLDDGLRDEGVEVGHQFAVNIRHVQVLRDDGDEAHGAVPDPQVGVTQERSYGGPEGTQSSLKSVNTEHKNSAFQRFENKGGIQNFKDKRFVLWNSKQNVIGKKNKKQS